MSQGILFLLPLLLASGASGCNWNSFYDSMGRTIPDSYVEISSVSDKGSLLETHVFWGDDFPCSTLEIHRHDPPSFPRGLSVHEEEDSQKPDGLGQIQCPRVIEFRVCGAHAATHS